VQVDKNQQDTQSQPRSCRQIGENVSPVKSSAGNAPAGSGVLEQSSDVSPRIPFTGGSLTYARFLRLRDVTPRRILAVIMSDGTTRFGN